MRLIIRMLAIALYCSPSPVLAQSNNVQRLPSRDSNSSQAARGTTDPQTILSEADPLENLAVGNPRPQQEWKGRHFLLRTAPGPRPNYGYIGDHVTIIDNGAGQNGPSTAGYARGTSILKSGFPLTSSPVGELDGQLVFVRQSGPTPTDESSASDLDGIQINVQQAGDPGYMAGTELLATRINPNAPYSQTHSVGVQLAIVDPFGKNGETGRSRYSGVNRLSFGIAALANLGALDRAFYATNTASGTWEDFAYFGSPGIPLFRVKGTDGSIVLGNNSNSVILSKNELNQLTVKSSNGPAAQVQTVPGPWSTYTPDVAAQAGGALGKVNSSGRFQIVGKRLDLIVRVQWGAGGRGTGTGGLVVGLPSNLTARGFCVGAGRDQANGSMLQGFITSGGSTLNINRYDNGSPIVSAADINVSLVCEIN
ncbi:hypothetical protein [Methylobacterium iners]|uniref:Phosphodiester glycosidase domain-containing protein n=1 Tax=Methylobacterium iners TaxID=418707 RepID=A0ABQ4S4F5_9HYPH|nr:hypothetical protein [Methylobacterium iners]GJD96642.1 hypothetical protein OCOJLMKI_3865 [Methylobacterium iners]